MSRTAKFIKEIEIELPAEALADLFCELDSDEQAAFLGYVADKMTKWGSFRAQSQALHIAKEIRGTSAALWVAELAEATK